MGLGPSTENDQYERADVVTSKKFQGLTVS